MIINEYKHKVAVAAMAQLNSGRCHKPAAPPRRQRTYRQASQGRSRKRKKEIKMDELKKKKLNSSESIDLGQ